uniref:AlNc14C31G2888 protein n=1 Tax=Albugo laibachii Nc14 TaxID=890382 RepID=F0W7T5_9STRA|nr:AlNc14C31G2888 [Albugo laibachii Nc14]|eukprot:CCA17187.1 AlNc14C31G2888 [Albugo laibachii Nc14]
MGMFPATKSPARIWKERYLYLVAESEVCGGDGNLVLDNIVHYADPSMRIFMLSRQNLVRADYLRQEGELDNFAQSMKIELKSRQLARDVVNVARQEAKTAGNAINAYIGSYKLCMPEKNR